MLLPSWDWFYLIVITGNFYSTASAVIYYIMFKRSKYTLTSPKKYKKYELVYNKNQKLYDLLAKIDKNNVGLKPENAIDKAIEMIEKM
jgi:hypothetical protein